MAQRNVGIRDLKAKLSEYIQHVKNGDTVVITERGKTVGRIHPTPASVEDRVESVIRSGAAAWSGRPLTTVRPVSRLKRGATTLADLVNRNRD